MISVGIGPNGYNINEECGSTYPAAMVRAFKGRTARVLRHEFQYLRRFAKVLWSSSYFAASVGYVSESTVRRYIGHQWDAVAR